MAKIGRICKEHMIKELTQRLKKNPALIVTECTGLNVAEIVKLRSGLTAKASYMVIKNSLGKLALKDAKCDSLIPLIEGSIGLVYNISDPVAVSKTLLNFSKDSGKLKVKGAFLEGKVLSQEDIKTLSLLPSREVLLARAFAGMKAPISGFVNVLGGTIRKFVYAVNAVQKKKEGGGSK